MLWAVSIVGDHDGSKRWLFPLTRNVIHKAGGIAEKVDGLLSPFARVYSANQKEDVDEEQVDDQAEEAISLA